MDDLFSINRDSAKPLAERMRCSSMDDFIGQEHIVGKDSLLRRAIKIDRLGSCIFYGPPGTGKTTLANIIANSTNSVAVYLNAVTNGVQDAKKVIDEAKQRLSFYGKKTYLILDECHRWNKSQSDSVLSAIEKGEIIFIGSTTENPYISMTKAIVSRCRIFEFKALTIDNILIGINRALSDKTNGVGNYNIIIDEDTKRYLAFCSNGDLRVALNSLELAILTTIPNKDGSINITKEVVSQSLQRPVISIDNDNYYDMLSAFCKSLRGSDPNAAVFYATRLIESGVDPLLICRRLIAHSAEDVGLADHDALLMAVSSLIAMQNLGLPEGLIPLTEAIIYVCKAPKSNSVVNTLYSAQEKAKEGHDNVPMYLRDPNYKNSKISGYKYPHDYGGYIKQQYLPDDIKDCVFYNPSNNGEERLYHDIWKGYISSKKDDKK
ncbi:MAG: replication-associated recombination protein A [Clostridia bacterium]|nr:replication-associated recombination protein A [Clostridia bacterium]